MLTIITAVWASFFLPQYISPYIPIENGFYQSHYKANGVIYHYGAKTAVCHILSVIAFNYAVCINALPTLYILPVILYIIIIFKKKSYQANWIDIIIFCCFLVPIGFSVMGQPAVARYYAPIMNMATICFISIVINHYSDNIINILQLSRVKLKILLIAIYIITISEIYIYSPNIVCFSPIWHIYSTDIRQNVRLGCKYAGEAFSWGEEFALAINKILLKEQSENISSKTFYSNYGLTNLHYPNLNAIHINSIATGNTFPSWNDNEYFILTKSVLYRSPVPTFITEIKPFDTISYKGEICTWIYTGNQLKDYKEYFYN